VHRWRQFINDCHKFLIAKEDGAERVAELGWNDLELFGCCRRPLESAWGAPDSYGRSMAAGL
jgi:hypothetical protein